MSIKTYLTRIFDGTIVRTARYINVRARPRYTLLEELEKITAEECSAYVIDKMGDALSFPKKELLWEFALARTQGSGLFVEFGVFAGTSINFFASRRPETIIYGFDSFQGLAEDWAGSASPKGAFSMGGVFPKVGQNVRLIAGWFTETLPQFLAENTGAISFAHIDCDTYEATNSVFVQISSRLVVGSVLIFDEYFGYRGWMAGEFKAWQECAQRNGIPYKYLAFSTEQVAIQLI